jgi:hypothetical protein
VLAERLLVLRVSGFGIRVSGFGFRNAGWWFRAWGWGFRVRVSGFRFRIRVSGVGFMGFRVWGNELAGCGFRATCRNIRR